MRLCVRFRPFEFPSVRLRGVSLSPENAGDVLAAVELFFEPSVAGEWTSLRLPFFSVAKCTHLFLDNVSEVSVSHSVEVAVLCVSGTSRTLWLVDDA